MTDSHAQSRPQSTPYAALRTDPIDDAAKGRADAPAQRPAELDYLAAEADRLEHLKQALYTAFSAAPKSGIPTALVDLAATYTSALRLQLSLKGYAAVPQRGARAPMFGPARTK